MKKGILFGAIAAVLLALVIVGASSVYTVAENEYACTFRFSEIVNTADQPGLHFKIPFIDTVKVFPKTTMFYDIPPSEVLTLDKQNMTVDCYILWSISDPQQFYRAVGNTNEAEERLNAITYSVLKRSMGTLAQADIINMEDGGERNEIYEGIATSVDSQTKVYGIHVEDVKIKQFDLTESNLNAVYERMISERNQMAAGYTADGSKKATLKRNEVDQTVNIMISNAEAEAAKLVAEGEAEYMKLLADAYGTQEKKDFYEFMLALDALEQSLTGQAKTVILDADSELGKILMGAANAV